MIADVRVRAVSSIFGAADFDGREMWGGEADDEAGSSSMVSPCSASSF